MYKYKLKRKSKKFEYDSLHLARIVSAKVSRHTEKNYPIVDMMLEFIGGEIDGQTKGKGFHITNKNVEEQVKREFSNMGRGIRSLAELSSVCPKIVGMYVRVGKKGKLYYIDSEARAYEVEGVAEMAS